jgi:hypothetical protein
VEFLLPILQKSLAEHQAKILAHDCASNKLEAVKEVNRILDHTGPPIDVLLDRAKNDKAKEVVREYARRDQDAVALVGELLEGAGTSMDAVVADALAENIETIERFDRLTTLAEGRRNASLREIDRHRVVLGELLRRTMQQIEEGKFAVIEAAPSKGKNAA